MEGALRLRHRRLFPDEAVIALHLLAHAPLDLLGVARLGLGAALGAARRTVSRLGLSFSFSAQAKHLVRQRLHV